MKKCNSCNKFYIFPHNEDVCRARIKLEEKQNNCNHKWGHIRQQVKEEYNGDKDRDIAYYKKWKTCTQCGKVRILIYVPVTQIDAKLIELITN